MLRRASWSRWVALVLLLWGLCDLTVPGFCQSDFTDIRAVAAQIPASTAASSAQSKGIQVTQQTQHPAPAPVAPTSDSDDCWCCCSHIVTQPFAVSLIQFRLVSDHPQIASADSPVWRVSDFFQPPKI